MGRLKGLPPLVRALPPQVGYAPDQAKARAAGNRAARPWLKWYATARWKKLARATFARDRYRCQRTGVICAGKYPAPNSPVANHRVPHRGDPAKFWDPENIETVSKAAHDSIIQREEQAVPVGRWD